MTDAKPTKPPAPPSFLHPTGAQTGVVTIGSIDDTTKTVVAQYNPKELQIDRTVPWQKNPQPNKSPDVGIQLEFTGAEGRTMSLELLFDGYETGDGAIAGQPGITVSKAVGLLNELASPIDAKSPNENLRRPHQCLVVWGSTVPDKSFQCVIESLSIKYTMFSAEGAPLRATCTVKVKEANSVKMKKDDSKKGTSTTGGTSSGGA